MRYGLLLGMAVFVSLSLPAMGGTISGSPDSVIIGDVALVPGQTQVTVPVYFVTHGDATYYNLPLRVESDGDIRFQGYLASEALEGWDDNWQGLANDSREALQMGFSDLGGGENAGLNTSGLRVEAMRLVFSIGEHAMTMNATITSRIDQRTGTPLFGYSDGIQSTVPVVVDGSVALGSAPEITSMLPTAVSLDQNYPNPFNPSTDIKFALPDARFVKITVFNVLGQEIRKLASEVREAGYHKVTWDGRNSAGGSVPSGTYFYRLDAGDFSQSMKMVLLK